MNFTLSVHSHLEESVKDTLCIGGGHSHHQFGVNLVGFHAIIFTVQHFICPNFTVFPFFAAALTENRLHAN